MARWLRSGIRRDVCVVLADHETPTGQEVKTALEAHYDDRLSPETFYGALEALVDAGHVEKRADGIHDRYALTDAGERALRDHYEWLADCVG